MLNLTRYIALYMQNMTYMTKNALYAIVILSYILHILHMPICKLYYLKLQKEERQIMAG